MYIFLILILQNEKKYNHIFDYHIIFFYFVIQYNLFSIISQKIVRPTENLTFLNYDKQSFNSSPVILNSVKNIYKQKSSFFQTETRPEKEFQQANYDNHISELYEKLSANIVQNKTFSSKNMNCGWDSDCKQWYDAKNINESVSFMIQHGSILQPYIDYKTAVGHQKARQKCESQALLKSGGWCLHSSSENLNMMETPNGSFQIPKQHYAPSPVIVREMINFIDNENIESINDFGAGVGQYKAAILKARPHFIWNSFDGCGNIENYTHGFVSWIDLTMPISIPLADWVVSFEVGEHIPNQYEAMFFRNLHKHNKKGIILSWAVLKQGGFRHVNCHSNNYVVHILQQLGYQHDLDLQKRFRGSSQQGKYTYFFHDLMVFRRIIPVPQKFFLTPIGRHLQNYNINTYTLYKKKYDLWIPTTKCIANKVVFGVLSNKFELRQNIRKSWGSLVCVFFILASEFQTENLITEMHNFNDIVVVKISEAYSGWKSALPIKTAAWFTFVYENMHQIEFVVKTDDDSYIRALPMIKHLKQLNADYSGFIRKNSKPIRDKNSRHYTPYDMYSGNKFPDFALGAAYSLSSYALRCFSHKIQNANYISNEDVATGIVMSLCNISATHDGKIFADEAFKQHVSFPFTVKHHVSDFEKYDSTPFLVKIVLNGRLGNHLFKIASAAGIANYYNARACYDGNFLGNNLFNVHIQECKKDTLPVKEVHEIGHALFDMPDWSNYLISYNMLLGSNDYRQSFKYFQDLDVEKIFSIKPHLKTEMKNKINNFDNNCTKIGIHVRRTDMLFLDSHINLPGIDYFQKAVRLMKTKYSNIIFYVVSDDISWCEKNFVFDTPTNVIFLKGSKEDDFITLTQCHHIILSVGTFGWWSAFLGSHQRGGDVIYYHNEFAQNHVINKGKVIPEDYYLQNWISL